MYKLTLIIFLQLTSLTGYCQQASGRERVKISPRDTAGTEGWIDALPLNRFEKITSIVFFKDSGQSTGTRYFPSQLNAFKIVGGDYYVSAATLMKLHSSLCFIDTTEASTREPQAFFWKVIEEGNYTVLSTGHIDHDDFYIYFYYNGTFHWEQLFFPNDNCNRQPHLQGIDSYEDLLTIIVSFYPFTPTWRKYLITKINLSDRESLPSLINDLNLAHRESLKEQAENLAREDNELDLSLSAGGAQGYGQLRDPHDKERLSDGWMSSLFAAAEIVGHIRSSRSIRFRFHYGWSNYNFSKYNFQCKEYGVSSSFSWPYKTRQLLYLGLGVNINKSIWKPVTAQEVRDAGLKALLEPDWWALHWRGGIILNKSKLEFGLMGYISSHLGGAITNNPAGIHLYAAKHLDFPLGKWLRRFDEFMSR